MRPFRKPNVKNLKQSLKEELLKFLNEELGVNIDVDNLSKFIINYLKDKEYGQILINKEQLPELKNVNINKIIIDYNKTGISDYLDIKKSQITNDGAILYFHLDGLDYNSIYHEINHALQFFVLGKERSKLQLTTIKAVNIAKLFAQKNKEITEYFSQLIYRSTEQEINSEVVGVYGELMTHLRNKGWEKGQLSNDDNFKVIFEQYVKNSKPYDNALHMIKFNVFELFDANNLRGADNYDVRVYFTFMQDIMRSRPFYSGIIDFFRLIKDLLTYKYRQIFNVDILSEEQVNSLMKKYQLFINKQGEKLRRKLFRLFDLFL